MSVAVVTGSAGLIGSEATRYFADLGMEIVGLDNDMRAAFFGQEASTSWSASQLRADLGPSYQHLDLDIRAREEVMALFARFGSAISLVIHTAAQPSHDWAARQPFTDFDINATGTLNLLEATRQHCPDAPFVFTSTNKVYGDRPNHLPLVERATRYELDASHPYWGGIPEDMPVDACLHSLFGASKLAADVVVQEYGRYFDMATACFRGGTLTGSTHAATELHGFLAYVMRCTMTGTPYEVFGYKGKQVRDAIHSADLIEGFHQYFKDPRVAAVYNIGGGRHSNASVLEAIELCQEIAGRELTWHYTERNRVGDHIWWIGDNSRFERDYPDWKLEYDVTRILQEIFEENRGRWTP
jgi:CDP-paratose 2-epimerase